MHRAQNILNHLAASPFQTLTKETVSGNSYPMGLLHGQVAIITGSGQGIGEVTARLFAKEGAKVVVTDIDQVKSDSVAHSIVQSGGTAVSFPGDVTDPQFATNILAFTVKSFGKVNIIVNNAGFTWDGVIHKMTDKQWDKILEVHNTAPFRIIRAAAPYMREQAKKEKDEGLTQEPRCIVNVSSVSGLHGNSGQINYATAKMGVIGLTKTVAKEWGPLGIRCNAVAFGTIKTRMTLEKGNNVMQIDANTKITQGIPKSVLESRDIAEAIPLGRAGDPSEAANAVLFLCSPMASYVNGHCLDVTGGSHL